MFAGLAIKCDKHAPFFKGRPGVVPFSLDIIPLSRKTIEAVFKAPLSAKLVNIVDTQTTSVFQLKNEKS